MPLARQPLQSMHLPGDALPCMHACWVHMHLVQGDSSAKRMPPAGKPLHQLVDEAGKKTRALKANRPTARELGSSEVPRQVGVEGWGLKGPGNAYGHGSYQRQGFTVPFVQLSCYEIADNKG